MMKTFCSTFLLLCLFAASVFAQSKESTGVLRIETVSDTHLEAALPDKDRGAEFQKEIGQIYDVYADLLVLGETKSYEKLVDSVYLTKVTRGKLIFGYIWEGEKVVLKKGYYLVPSGRKYAAKVQQLKKLTDKQDASLFSSDVVQLFHFTGGGLAIETGVDTETNYSGVLQSELSLLFFGRVGFTLRVHTNELFNVLNLDIEGTTWGAFPRADFLKYNVGGGVTFPLIDNNGTGDTAVFGISYFYGTMDLVFIIPLAPQGFFKDMYIGLGLKIAVPLLSADYIEYKISIPLKIGYRIF